MTILAHGVLFESGEMVHAISFTNKAIGSIGFKLIDNVYPPYDSKLLSVVDLHGLINFLTECLAEHQNISEI